MNERAPTVIYVDIDDTLVRSVGTRRIPIPAVVALVKDLAARQTELYAWSTAGGAYARQAAEELGIAGCFKAFLPKPRALLDDTAVRDWRLLEVHPAQCTMLGVDELLSRLE